MSAHKIEVNLVLFVLSHHELSECIDFRNILNSLVHQVFDCIHIDFLDFVLAQKAIDKIQLLLRRLDLVIL